MARSDPPRWTNSELEEGLKKSLASFVEAWGAEGSERYERLVSELSVPVTQLFEETSDLAHLGATTFMDRPALLAGARFLTAPPISEGNLRTLIGGNLGVKQPVAERADRAAQLIGAGLDHLRFTWIRERRTASDAERRTAILWTASLWAIESMRTHQRLASSKAQELAVADLLTSIGFERVPRRVLDALEKLPPGTFTGESLLGKNRCDVPVRLRDGRLLALECKVSNTAVNSKKRLNDSGGAKAKDWYDTFGAQVIAGVVLSGVYSLGNLVTAQNDQRITIFWAHDLGRLAEFVVAAA